MRKNSVSRSLALKKRFFKTIGIGIVASMLTTSFAYATDGDSSSTTGETGQNGYTSQVVWATNDNFGPATVETVSNVLTNNLDGVLGGNATEHVKTVIEDANNKCVEKYANRHHGERNAQCRVFAVGAVRTDQTKWIASYTGSLTEQQWLNAWKQETNNFQKPFTHEGVTYNITTPFSDGVTSINSLVAREIRGGNKSLVVVVLASDQPPTDYMLNVSTDAQHALNMRVGDSQSVADIIHASGGDNSERVNAQVILHYDGMKYEKARQAAKTVSIATNGDTRSPDFTPSDLGMPFWFEGKYWFDVQILKQGRMKSFTSKGTQCWRCKSCHASSVHKNSVVSREFKQFPDWQLSSSCQTDMNGGGHSLSRHCQQFWRLWTLPSIVNEVTQNTNKHAWRMGGHINRMGRVPHNKPKHTEVLPQTHFLYYKLLLPLFLSDFSIPCSFNPRAIFHLSHSPICAIPLLL